ncbi:hypothetical protein JTB14_013582 [Gonioctena quinquepunctata]|nr:hypothetical protein JTB14_013582 [Gonioctena quinquepunctata]
MEGSNFGEGPEESTPSELNFTPGSSNPKGGEKFNFNMKTVDGTIQETRQTSPEKDVIPRSQPIKIQKKTTFIVVTEKKTRNLPEISCRGRTQTYKN